MPDLTVREHDHLKDHDWGHTALIHHMTSTHGWTSASPGDLAFAHLLRVHDEQHGPRRAPEEARGDSPTKTFGGDVTPDDVVTAMIWPEPATVSPTDATLLVYALEKLTPVQNNAWDERILQLTEALKPHAVLCTYDREHTCRRWGTEERDGLPWCADHEPHEVMPAPERPEHCGRPMHLVLGVEEAWWNCAMCDKSGPYMEVKNCVPALRLVGVDA